MTKLLLPVGVVKSMQTRYENEILDKFLDQRRADARLPVWVAFGKSEEFSEAADAFLRGCEPYTAALRYPAWTQFALF